MNKKVLIGLSWPYANGRLHVGHIASSLPGDVLARYHRMAGNDVSFVSGSDCYGTPILVAARAEGVTPLQLSDKYHNFHANDFKSLGFTFDNYTKTTSKHHGDFVREFHRGLYTLHSEKTEDVVNLVYPLSAMQLYCEDCNKYLPDRYVEGICPHCKADAKGDSCDGCGKILEPEELQDPKCKLCKGSPVPRDTRQLMLRLSALENNIRKHYESKKETWANNAVGLTGRYLNEGLRDRAITRNIEWGVELPKESQKIFNFSKDEMAEKKIYIWAENVLGYLAATKEFCDSTKRDWKEFLLNSGEHNCVGCPAAKKAKCMTPIPLHYYVHAKDNIPFHSIILPGLLLANGSGDYHLPDMIVSSEYVTLANDKMSKSKGNLITAEELYNTFYVDAIRYYFLRNVNDRKDVNFTMEDFAATVNAELVNGFGNLVNRTLSFIKSKLDGQLYHPDAIHLTAFDIKETIHTFASRKGLRPLQGSSPKGVAGLRPAPLSSPLEGVGGGIVKSQKEIEKTFDDVGDLIYRGKINKALHRAMELVNLGNKMFDEFAPWKSIKEDVEKCKRDLFEVVTIIVNLAVLLKPFVPNACDKLAGWLGIDLTEWTPIYKKDFAVGDIEVLVKRIELKS